MENFNGYHLRLAHTNLLKTPSKCVKRRSSITSKMNGISMRHTSTFFANRHIITDLKSIVKMAFTTASS